jgi:hypothetical protein
MAHSVGRNPPPTGRDADEFVEVSFGMGNVPAPYGPAAAAAASATRGPGRAVGQPRRHALADPFLPFDGPADEVPSIETLHQRRGSADLEALLRPAQYQRRRQLEEEAAALAALDDPLGAPPSAAGLRNADGSAKKKTHGGPEPPQEYTVDDVGVFSAATSASRLVLATGSVFIVVGVMTLLLSATQMPLYCADVKGTAAPGAPPPATTAPVAGVPASSFGGSVAADLGPLLLNPNSTTTTTATPTATATSTAAPPRWSVPAAASNSPGCSDRRRPAEGAEYFYGLLPLLVGAAVLLAFHEYHIEWDDNTRRVNTLRRPALCHLLPFLSPSWMVQSQPYQFVNGIEIDVTTRAAGTGLCTPGGQKAEDLVTVTLKMRGGWSDAKKASPVVFRQAWPILPVGYRETYLLWVRRRLVSGPPPKPHPAGDELAQLPMPSEAALASLPHPAVML